MEVHKWELDSCYRSKRRFLYITQGNLCRGKVNVVHDNSNSELWPRRLGNISEKELQILAHKELILDLKGQLLDPCTNCLASKQYKVIFQRNGQSSKRKYILELAHTNVCSVSTKSRGGALYFVTFINDHSRKIWISLLRSKD